MAERKIFGLFKTIPIVGHGYGLIRGIAYRIAGDENEAKHSLEMDLANLNPLRIPRNIVNSTISLVIDLDENIWLGKRTLGDQPIGLSFALGSDIYHWCIQIDAVIYELLLQDGSIYIDITSKYDHPYSYECLCKRFSWTLLRRQSSCVSGTTLRDYAKSFESYRYRAVLPSGSTVNCQTFVTMMLAKAIGKTCDQAAAIIFLIVPNLAW
jgi:hypothetical protein